MIFLLGARDYSWDDLGPVVYERCINDSDNRLLTQELSLPSFDPLALQALARCWKESFPLSPSLEGAQYA